jgi:hypothetical protein
MCQMLLKENYITHVESKLFFEASPTSYYQFLQDRNDIPDNGLRKWKNNPRNALEVSIELLQCADDLFSEAVVETDDGMQDIDAEKAMKSQAF